MSTMSTNINIDSTDYTEILEVNLFAFTYRLFHEDFSPLDGTQIRICSWGKEEGLLC